MEMTFKKIIINLFITLFISGVALSFLLGTKGPIMPTKAEKYILFEKCKPYYDMTNIPKTVDEFKNLDESDYIHVNDKYLDIQTDILYRTASRIDKAEKNRNKSTSLIIPLPNLPLYSYGYYKNHQLLLFQIPIDDNSYTYFYCKYNNEGKLVELTYDRGDIYAYYNYKGHILEAFGGR